ncbi:MAG: thioredoxin-like domain-containing protein [Chthoniobacterales bacterium]
MRNSLVAAAVIFAASICAAALAPLTVKDVSLMLRSGYSSDEVTRELSTRRFLGSLDSATEKALLEFGAKAELIAALRNGAYTLSAEQAAAAQKDLEAKTKMRTMQAEQARKVDLRYQSELAKQSAPQAPSSSGRIIDQLKGDLVTSRNGSLSTFNDEVLDKKKLIGLYFSAHWCSPCRKFTPMLVDYYNRVAAAHPEFEILFISNDRSGPAMEAYMRDAQMPWPAVRFDKIVEKAALLKYAGEGIPCLVIIDPSGRVISDSFNGKNYRGPDKVLADLDLIFARGDGAQLASGR